MVSVAGALVLTLGASIVLGGAAEASPVCIGSSICEADNLWVLGVDSALTNPAGAASASQVVATAATSSGVSGVSMAAGGTGLAGGVVSGTAGLLAGAAAYVGLRSWEAGRIGVGDDWSGITLGTEVPGWTAATFDVVEAGFTTRWAITGEVVYSGVDPYGAASFPTASVSATATAVTEIPYGTSSQTKAALVPICKTSAGVLSSAGTATSSNITGTWLKNDAAGVNLSGSLTATTAGASCGSGKTFVGWLFRPGGSVASGATAAAIAGWVAAGDPWYYTPASPLRPPLVDLTTARVTRQVDCVGPAGAFVRITSSTTIQVVAGSEWEYPALTCPEGMVVGTFSADLTPSGTGAQTQTLVPETDTGLSDYVNDYPECVSSTCLLRLFKVAPNGNATSCGVQAIACPDWYTDPTRSEDYECHFGPYTVDLSYCSTYRVPGQTLPNAQVKPDGTTEVVPWPETPTTTDPGTRPDPDPSGNTSEESSACFPTGWSAFNPVEWVLRPVKCALTWAFVPSAATTTAWTGFADDVSGHPPVNYAIAGVTYTTAVVDGVNGEGDCTALPLQMAGGPLGPGASFDLCAAVTDVAHTSWGQLLRAGLGVVIVGAGIWRAYHRITGSVGSKA